MATVVIEADLGNVSHIIAAEMAGAHYSPLNNQLRFLSSELVDDASFEQAVAGPAPWWMPDFNVSRGWSNRSVGNAVPPAGCVHTHAILADFLPPAFNGRVAMRLQLGAKSAGESRAAIVNRGLWHAGFSLHAGREYEGYFFVRSATTASIVVALEEQPLRPLQPLHSFDRVAHRDERAANATFSSRLNILSLHPPVQLASKILRVKPGGWQRVDFTLIPDRNTSCVGYPANTPPLMCTESKEESGTCVACSGQLSISLLPAVSEKETGTKQDTVAKVGQAVDRNFGWNFDRSLNADSGLKFGKKSLEKDLGTVRGSIEESTEAEPRRELIASSGAQSGGALLSAVEDAATWLQGNSRAGRSDDEKGLRLDRIVDVDYVSLQPGAWGRFKFNLAQNVPDQIWKDLPEDIRNEAPDLLSREFLTHNSVANLGITFGDSSQAYKQQEVLPVHASAGEWLRQWGVRMLRYGGTFSEGSDRNWQYYRGPPSLRPPDDGPPDKLREWSRDWGPFEHMSLCEALGAMSIISLPRSQTADELADFVEYAFGDARATQLGALRARDGRYAPFNASRVAIQIGNEDAMSHFLGSFAKQAAAMESRAKSVGVGGRLRYVVGSDERSDAGETVVGTQSAVGNVSAILRELKSAGLCAASQIAFDWHIRPQPFGGARSSVSYSHLRLMRQLIDASGCPGVKVYVLETNECEAHFQRALDDAGSAIAAQATAGASVLCEIAFPDPLLAAYATSQFLTAAGHFNGCGEGHVNALPNQTWGAPPFYAAQMTHTSQLPLALTTTITTNTTTTITAHRSTRTPPTTATPTAASSTTPSGPHIDALTTQLENTYATAPTSTTRLATKSTPTTNTTLTSIPTAPDTARTTASPTATPADTSQPAAAPTPPYSSTHKSTSSGALTHTVRKLRSQQAQAPPGRRWSESESTLERAHEHIFARETINAGVARSEDGRRVVVRMVNIANQSTQAEISLRGLQLSEMERNYAKVTKFETAEVHAASELIESEQLESEGGSASGGGGGSDGSTFLRGKSETLEPAQDHASGEATARVKLTQLTSPLTGTPQYDLQLGGVNTIGDPTFISPKSWFRQAKISGEGRLTFRLVLPAQSYTIADFEV